jgi:hypothetical protein
LIHRDSEAGNGAAPEPTQAPRLAPTAIGGCEVSVRRTGRVVEIALAFSSDYATIELYDTLVRSVQKGSLRLELSPLRV